MKHGKKKRTDDVWKWFVLILAMGFVANLEVDANIWSANNTSIYVNDSELNRTTGHTGQNITILNRTMYYLGSEVCTASNMLCKDPAAALGNGTSGYIPKWNNATHITDSLIYQNATFIGINKTNPATALDVNGKIKASDDINTTGMIYLGTGSGALRFATGSSMLYIQTAGGGNPRIYATGGALLGNIATGYYSGSIVDLQPTTLLSWAASSIGSGQDVALGRSGTNTLSIYPGTTTNNPNPGYGDLILRSMNSTGNITFNGTTQPIILLGNATVWDDLVVPIAITKIGLNAISFDENHAAYLFEDKSVLAQEQYTFVTLQLPHAWKEGSDIGCHLHVSAIDNSTGNATFEMSYIWTNIGAQESSTKTNITTTIAFTAQQDVHQLLDFGRLNGTGKTFSSVLEARIRRKSSLASDNYAASVEVMSFDCHWERDKLGSNGEYTVW